MMNKKMRSFLCLLLTCSLVANAALEEKSIIVMMVVNNAKSYIKRSLESVLNQEYGNYTLLIIDDGSDDGTLDYIKDYASERNCSSRLSVCKNKIQRNNSMINYLRGSKISADDDIMVVLDPQNFFAHNRVLSQLNELYQSKDIWMTYGPSREYPSYKLVHDANVPEIIMEFNAYRDYLHVPQHLQSFYAGLFKKIPLGRLTLSLGELTADREFIRMNNDLPIMLAMLELAGSRAYRVAEPLTLINAQLQQYRYIVDEEDHETMSIRTRGIPRCVRLTSLES